MKRIGALLALSALAGCATRPAQDACQPPARAAVTAELLLGLSVPGNGQVTQPDFDRWVATELSPRFPAGLSILPADGRSRDPDGTPVREAARIALIVAPDTAATAAALDQAARSYRLAFHQHSVGIVTVASCASF